MRFTLNILSLAVALFAAHALMRGLLPAPLHGLPAAVRGILALAILGLGIRGFAAGRSTPEAGQPTRRRKPGWLDHTVAAGALLTLHFAFLWLLGAAPPVIERIGIATEAWLRPENAARRSASDADEARAKRPGNWLWQDRRSRALPRRTDLSPGNRPEVFLRFATPADAALVVGNPAYLSAFALSTYDNDRWTTAAIRATPVEATDAGASRFSTPSARAGFNIIEHEVFHGPNAAGQDVLIALQGVESAGITPLERFDDGFVMLPPPPKNTIGYQYRARSRPLTLSDMPPDTPVPVAQEMSPTLLEMPANTRVATHLAEQARWIVGENPTVGSLIKLEQWLRDAFDYSLETTNPLNLDPLENFLFSERRGHCEHFAMTGALMLRALGFPTRIAYGWAGGTWYESSRLMVFRSREAHAWTEIWIPELGWVVMDPTPPSGIDGNRSRVASPDEEPPDPLAEMTDDEDSIGTTRVDLAAAWLVGIFGLPALLMLGLRVRRRSGTLVPVGATANGPAPGYLGVWNAACPSRRPGETLRQQIRRFDSEPPFAADLIDYHYRIQYTHARRDPKVERELERAIRHWHRDQETPHPLE